MTENRKSIRILEQSLYSGKPITQLVEAANARYAYWLNEDGIEQERRKVIDVIREDLECGPDAATDICKAIEAFVGKLIEQGRNK